METGCGHLVYCKKISNMLLVLLDLEFYNPVNTVKVMSSLSINLLRLFL